MTRWPIWILGLTSTVSAQQSIPALTAGQSGYLQSCGGCHGVDGTSESHLVPSLRNVAGAFLCSPAARSYLVRLPNIAFANADNAALAALLNFVVFDLGGDSAPRGARPFSSGEIGALRSNPLKDVSIKWKRAQAVQEASERCAQAKLLSAPGAQTY
jgi:hypothetical protein